MLATRRLAAARAVAESIPDVDAGSLEVSTRKGKRFKIRSPAGKLVHFGVWRDEPAWLSSVERREGRGTFIDHQDPEVRAAWRARHSRITDARGRPFYQNPESPEFYSWHILW